MKKVKRYKQKYLFRKKQHKAAKALSMLFACVLFVVSSTIVLTKLKGMYDSYKLDEELKAAHNSNRVIDNPLEIDTDENGELAQSPGMINIAVNQDHNNYTVYLPGMEALIDKNPDTVGWITIPGTQVDNVVVQSDDNSFYLTHNFNFKKNEAGTIFADRMCQVLPYQKCDNLVLYGHNQMNGSMFGSLTNYKKDPLFVLNAPIIYYQTNYEVYQYVVFSFFLVNTDPNDDDEHVFPYHEYINFDDTYSFDYWLYEVKRRSLLNSQIETLETDQYITLSTCAVEFDGARFVVIGRKLRPNEHIDTGYSVNTTPYYPDIYYKKHGDQYQY